MNKFVSNIVRKWQLVLYTSLMLGAVTFFISTAITPKYRSDVTVLIVQKNADVLTASQNAEYLSEIFQKVLYTESFMRGVLKSDGEIQREFSGDAKKRMQEWEDEIESYKVGSAGILKISVFDPTRQDAYKIAVGVLRNFKENSAEYFGEKGEVEIKILDGPITSSGVAYPNIKQNTFFGLVVGFIGSLFVIYFFKDFDLRLVKRPKKGLAFLLKSSEIAIEQKIGDQLARQLEKRKDNVAFEYLEKQVKQQDEMGTALGNDNIFSDNIVNEGEAEKFGKERKKQLTEQQVFANSELEYIEIPEEEEFVVNKENDEFIGFDKKQIKDIAENINRKGEIQTTVAMPAEVFSEERSNDNFWENMRAIDEPLIDLDEENDNPLLADSMIDIDTYYEIIRAGETFKGFKQLRKEEGQEETTTEIDELSNLSNAQLKELLLEDESVSEASAPIINDKKIDLPTMVSQESTQEEVAFVVLEDAGKKKNKEEKRATEVTKTAKEVIEEAEELELTAIGLRRILETQSKSSGIVETKEAVVAKKDEVTSGDEVDEDFEKIVQEKKDKEKNEIKRLLEEELNEKTRDAQKEADLVAEKEEDSSKIIEEVQIKKAENIEDIESINYIGSADKEEIESKGNEMSHHIEMDPEELEMMRKMLQAEGKTEEEFVAEHGLIEQEESQKGADKEVSEGPVSTLKEPVFEEIEESVRKVQVEEDDSQNASRSRKGSAPSDLPIFMEEENEQDAFARRLREEKTPKKASVDPKREVSEKEIKEKLNRLLQGEL
jgi:capsular polysaccharide biosynthesis protein